MNFSINVTSTLYEYKNIVKTKKINFFRRFIAFILIIYHQNLKLELLNYQTFHKSA